MCIYLYVSVYECTGLAGWVYVHGSPARPRCSVWCKLCMCKKHSIIRPSIIRGCQWALSGWYITLSCPLPQLGPTQPARHAGNTAGKTYSMGQSISWERCAVWHASPMIMMPYCKCRPKNYHECDLEGRVSAIVESHFKLCFINSLDTMFNATIGRTWKMSDKAKMYI